jgi:hypothetical protein
MRRALGQQHIGKAAGGGADVHRGGARGVQREGVDGMGQLDPAPADPGMIAPAHLQRRLGGMVWPGLAILVSPQNTSPASTSACARARLSTRPRSTSA